MTTSPTTIVQVSVLNRSLDAGNFTTELFGNGSSTSSELTEKLEFSIYFRVVSMVVCIVILTFGVIGNVMVPIVIIRTKDMRNSTNIFLSNLSFADLLVLLICTPTVLVEVNSKPETWVLGESLCKIIPFVELTVAHASVLTILAITFERYYAICEPLRAGYVCTKARAFLICMVAWFVAALCASPVGVISEYKPVARYKPEDDESVTVCLTQANTFWPAFFFISIIFLFYILPFFLLVSMYLIIARHLMADPETNCSEAPYNIRARKQVVAILAMVVVMFFICLLPFRILVLWIIFAPDEHLLALGRPRFYVILYACRIMVYLNAAINPILYNLMSSKFRKGFLTILHCGRNKNSQLRLRYSNTLTTSLSHSSTRGVIDRRESSMELLERRHSDLQGVIPRNGSTRKQIFAKSISAEEYPKKNYSLRLTTSISEDSA